MSILKSKQDGPITPSRGTEDKGDDERKVYPVIDPISYLYESVQSSGQDGPRNDNMWDLTWNFIVDFFRNTNKNEGGGWIYP